MNYLPFAGYWFYGATTAHERASFFCSWGLLESAPLGGVVIATISQHYRRLREE
jgi:hypothetical protein